MKRPRRLFIVTTADSAEPQFRTGDYNRATRLARDLASENNTAAQVADDEGVCYTVDSHGKTTTLRSVRD